METVELEPENSDPVIPARVHRGLALIAASTIAIAAAGIAYVHPAIPGLGHDSLPNPSLRSGYHVSAIDFVDPSIGWIVADFDSGDFAVLHTGDAGRSWTRQLSGSGPLHAHYIKFFDPEAGVFGQVGTAAALFRTRDGGKTWAAVPVPRAHGSVLSWSFVDSEFGWVLISGTTVERPLPAYLYRTEDGGVSWINLGVPAAAPDQVFQATFSFFTTGWLTSANAGPYAYKTADYGETWVRVALPPPAGGWPAGGSYLVAVQPTSGKGAAASVVFVPALRGRKSGGALIQDFPPLTVRAFDGGRPVTYMYATALGQRNSGPLPQAPNQVQLGTLDNGSTWTPIAAPSSTGTIGYADAESWWWIGAGKRATSSDGGSTWSSPSSIDARAPVPGSLQVLDRVHAWFASSVAAPPLLEFTQDGGAHWRSVSLPAVPDVPYALT